MRGLVSSFIERHLLTNVLFFGLILFAILGWFNIGKEELPEFESNWIRVSTIFPGAPAEDVELFVTKPLEDELKGVVGIEEIVTTSSVGISSLRITIDDDYPNKSEVTQDIKDAILRTSLPSEVREIPSIRQFKSSEKAILDIGIFHKEHTFLDTKAREEVQKYILSFENQLLSLPEISSLERSHYRKPELQIKVKPNLLLQKQISLAAITAQVRDNNIRAPIGSLKDDGESKVSAVNELDSVEALEKLILRGNDTGVLLGLSDVGKVQRGFEESTSIFKMNGHEGVFLNVKKNVSTDILTAQKKVMQFIERFKRNNKDVPIEIVLMDDESYAVTNRLDIVSTNGLIGFFLIIVVLLIFLDMKTGFWVAMGIPFSIAFTLIIAQLAGYTVNNMTLAGIIIVLGIVVDDAIIIAENISRHREEGKNLKDAAFEGTMEVIKPITASIVTTCVAFLPLIFFEGFFGKLVAYIPLIVIMMLIGSLIESLFILPSHLSSKTPLLERFAKGSGEIGWFKRIEDQYAKFLEFVFQKRFVVLTLFLIFLGGGAFLFHQKMRFVMFPREESKEVFIKIKSPKDFDRKKTAKAIAPLEKVFAEDKENVVAVRSSIALSRRGGEVKENEASILVELIPADDRSTSLNTLLERWESAAKEMEGIESARFLRGRWGNSSGNSLILNILENNDKTRAEVAKKVEDYLSQRKDVKDIEVEEPIMKKEYVFHILQDQLIRYDVAPREVTTTLRSFVEGSILYSINKGEEEVDVRLTVEDSFKEDLNSLLRQRVPNRGGNLVYLKNMVKIEETQKPLNIKRTNFKRVSSVLANHGGTSTPLEIAEAMENELFPLIIKESPTTVFQWDGEVKDSRESQGEFLNAVVMVILVIYLILVIMFDSLTRPFLVLCVVPFGLSGVVYTLLAHDMGVYGFFAAIGALGMIGVVINDAIVMIDKLDKMSGDGNFQEVARVAASRLRPVIVTTVTTVVGVLPTAYGLGGYDSLLAEMMLTMGWGLAVGTFITLVLIPTLYSFTVKEV